MSEAKGGSALTRSEIASQPQLWREAVRLGRSGVVGLPAPGESLLVLGCGTSYYVGQAYALLREAAGQGLSDALVANDLPSAMRRYDRVVAISRSGTSSELIDAVKRVRAESPETRVTAFLGEQGTPLADVSDDVVDLSFADERSVVQTRFPSTQLMLVRAALGEQGLESVIEQGEAALEAPIPSTDVRQVVFLAQGWGTPVATEAALKVRESSGTWVESYPVPEYRHGPVAACGAGSLVWGFDALPADIVDLVTAAGGSVENGCGEPLVELVRAHRFAVDLAARVGRDADSPSLLSRSVIR